jgi:tetratricopeptide (TPR) repeat protein
MLQRPLLLLALIALIWTAVNTGRAAAPPAPLGKATPLQLQKLAALNTKSSSAIIAGRFGDALALAQKLQIQRQRWQGSGHWDTINARFQVVRLELLAPLSAADQAQISKAIFLGARGHFENKKGNHREAEKWHRQALAIFQKVLGDDKLETAISYDHLADCLKSKGKPGQALPLNRKALAIYTQVLGEEHPRTAGGYNSIADCLLSLGRPAEALPLFQKALAILIKVLGEDHPETAVIYNNVAPCLQALSRPALALPFCRKALAVQIKVLGEDHQQTAVSHNNLAYSLQFMGKPGQALPHFQKALAISKRVLGEEHLTTTACCNGVAVCLKSMGKPAQALVLYRKALAVRQKVLGEEHAETAKSYNNVAHCLDAMGDHAQALPLFRKALEVQEKVLGEDHPHTAISYSNVAYSLQKMGKSDQALLLFNRTLAINRKVLGEEHRDTAISHLGAAGCLESLGKSEQAAVHLQKALAINKKLLGEGHPDTALAYGKLGSCLLTLGKTDQAKKALTAALAGHAAGRVAAGDRGFERALATESITPHFYLALLQSRFDHPGEAWRHAEAGLARNLLEDVAGTKMSEDVRQTSRLQDLDQQILVLVSKEKRDRQEQQRFEKLTSERADLCKDLARQAEERSGKLVWQLEKIQKHLPQDAAVVFWLETNVQGNWACVLRSQGGPHWVKLKGTGNENMWLSRDSNQAQLFGKQISAGQIISGAKKEMRRRWFEPVEPHLRASDDLPGVRRLYVVPVGPAAFIPFEVLAPEFEISYTPSATLLARARAGHRPLTAGKALVLGDPPFRAAPQAKPPGYGLLLVQVLPGGNADKAGLRAGDVILRYADKRLADMDDLAGALKEQPRAEATYWRDGTKHKVQLAGPLGVRLDRREATVAVADWRGQQAGLRGAKYAPLPGTRAEALALQKLLGKGCQTLLGSDASEQKLEGMARDLKQFRLIHLATHGQVDLERPDRSALILARDRLPGLNENEERVRQGKRPITGELTVEAILDQWKLDADLVVLSACQTGLGKPSSGDGLLGFSYALTKAGARSVLLSRWQVDDASTTLLMLRFYENVLGKREGLKKALGRAAALREAQQWLRELPRDKAEQLNKALKLNKLASTRGSVVPLKLQPGEIKLPAGDKPYAHPFHWAAFMLLGDPE